MRILMVDDEQDCLDMLQEALSPTGYDVVKQTNPILALNMIRNEFFDVVISDVRMPQMTGIELMERIKNFKPNQNVILMSGEKDITAAFSGIKSKNHSFFSKPIEFKELIKLLRSIENKINNT